MKKTLLLFLALSIALLALSCGSAPIETTVPPTSTVPTTVPETTVPETTVPPTTVPPTTAPLHSELYLDGCDPDTVLAWFEEVVLHVEYNHGDGDPSLVQKWLTPIRCSIDGEPTDEDLRVLEEFFAQLNEVPGFPGIAMAEEDEYANLSLSFLDADDFWDSFSDVVNGEDAWGATQFWYYTDNNELYSARIGYRTDIDQIYRSSILLEEIVNTLGMTDTEVREDSIVYQYSNDNLCLSDVDWLLLKLLYHPAIECGMNGDDCRAMIAQLYY